MASPVKMRQLLDVLDEPALLVKAGRVIAANGAAASLLGRHPEGSDIRLAIRQPEALSLIFSGEPADRDISGIGGIGRPWTLSVRPVGDGAVVVRLTDRSAARAAEKMRVDFVANASHELRTPLTTIIGYAETLSDHGDLDPAQHSKFAAIIGTEAGRMLRIVEDLMSLSRIEADRFAAPSAPVDVAQLVRSAADQAEEVAGQRGCTVAVAADADLPLVAGDRAQLLQLLDNLISNALRYGCGDGDCKVDVSARRESGGVAVSVRDDGQGIAPEHLPRLTERFYRIDEARSRDAGGTGLGLAIVKHIVERHRGTLNIRSTPGAGTEVTVILPTA